MSVSGFLKNIKTDKVSEIFTIQIGEAPPYDLHLRLAPNYKAIREYLRLQTKPKYNIKSKKFSIPDEVELDQEQSMQRAVAAVRAVVMDDENNTKLILSEDDSYALIATTGGINGDLARRCLDICQESSYTLPEKADEEKLHDEDFLPPGDSGESSE